VNWDATTQKAVEAIAYELGLDEVHLTGGEPTAHPRLFELVAGLRSIGLNVKATSIGCCEGTLAKLAANGLQGINFSVNALNPRSLHSTQLGRTLAWSKHQLRQQTRAIAFSKKLGLAVKINSVLAKAEDIPRVRGVLRWAESEDIPLRVMNELSSREVSYEAIEQFLKDVDAAKLYTKYVVASSCVSTYYSLPSSFQFAIKWIRENYLTQSMCSGCSFKRTGMCLERFYGIRLEKRKVQGEWELYVRLCIHRTDEDTLLSVDEFLQSWQHFEIKQQLKPMILASHSASTLMPAFVAA
jgi:cyclic pyranopterin phosphate synthase